MDTAINIIFICTKVWTGIRTEYCFYFCQSVRSSNSACIFVWLQSINTPIIAIPLAFAAN